MSLLTVSLFVGIALDQQFERRLKQNNPHLVALFTQGGDYLEEIEYNNQKYLGKFITKPPSFSELLNIESNVTSFLNRLAPDYCINSHPSRLLATWVSK